MYFNRLSQIAESEVQAEARRGKAPRLYISYKNIEIIAALLDVFIITFASVFGGVIYQYIWAGHSVGTEVCLAVGVSEGLLYAHVASSRGLYRLPVLLAPSGYLARIFVTWAIVALFVTTFLFFSERGERILPWGYDYVCGAADCVFAPRPMVRGENVAVTDGDRKLAGAPGRDHRRTSGIAPIKHGRAIPLFWSERSCPRLIVAGCGAGVG